MAVLPTQAHFLVAVRFLQTNVTCMVCLLTESTFAMIVNSLVFRVRRMSEFLTSLLTNDSFSIIYFILYVTVRIIVLSWSHPLGVINSTNNYILIIHVVNSQIVVNFL